MRLDARSRRFARGAHGSPSSRRARPLKGRSAVSIVGVEDEGVKSAVRRALRLIGGVRGIVKPGDKVLIKPNYMMPKHPRTAVTTDPRVVEAVADTVVEAGGNPIIGEGSVVGHDTGVSFRVVGAREISERTGVPLIDLNRDEAVEVEVPGGKALRSVKIARTVLECDRIIGVPKIKTHHSTLVTCCLKNMKGVIPGREKHVTHLSGLHQAIVDLNKVVKPDLSIVDGILSMEGPGPGFGRPVPTNLIVAGFDPVAVDSTVCRIMDIDPSDVLHIRLAAEQGLGVMEAGAIEIRGIGIEEAMRHFVRPPVTIASLEKFAY
ncbi:TPA: DUF362 domain-containing protein, partial [Candidatus Bathyarchaeota archaeon]|nr:DUF362 domain-containing protein [Candidatus Bathyarchaeota archaeon]